MGVSHRFPSLDQFVARSPTPMAMFDLDMRYLASSRTWLDDYDLAEEPTGRNHYELFPEISDDWKAVHRRVLAGATEASDRDRFERADGRVQWLRWEARPWTDGDGAIGGMVIAATDITALVEAQQRAEDLARRLGESLSRAEAAERRLKDAIDAVPAGFEIYDADGRLVVSNAAAEGMDPDPAAAKRSRIGVAAKGASAGVTAAEGDREDADRQPGEGVGDRQTAGRWLRVQERRTSDGGVVVIRTDITDLKAKKRELAEKTAFLETIFQNMGEGIWVFDANRRLLIAHDVVARLLDLPHDLAQPGALFEDVARFRAERGDFGDVDVDALVSGRIAAFREAKRWRVTTRAPNGRVIDTRFNPMPGGGGVVVFGDVTEAADSQAKLADRTAQLEEIQRSVVIRQEAERNRIARELHDSFGQHLAAIAIKLELVRRNAGGAAAVELGLAELKTLIGALGDEASRLARELRPVAIDDLGLAPAIRSFIAEWEHRSGLRFDLHLALDGRRFSSEVETTIYRVLQEGITNIVKHARASSVGVVLKAGPNDVVMMIEDDGIGFDQDAAARSARLGLRGMRERLDAVGGTLEVETGAGAGTTLIVRVVLDGRDAGLAQPIAAGLRPRGARERATDAAARLDRPGRPAGLIDATLRAMSEGVAAYDADRRLIIANDLAMEMLGATPALVRPGASFDDLVRFHAVLGYYGEIDDVEALVEARIGDLRAQRPWGWTRRLRDGRTVDTRINPTPEGGAVLVCRDVSGRAQAQEGAEDLARRLAAAAAQAEDAAGRAQTAERRLKSAIEVLPSSFVIYDSDDRLVVCNEAMRALHSHLAEMLRPGARRADLLAADYERRVAGRAPLHDDRESWIKRRLERRRNPAGQFEYRTPGGRWLLIEQRETPDGDFVAIHTDITALKARERELAEKTALLETTLASIGEGIAVFGPDLRLLMFNRSAEQLLDAPPGTGLAGASFEELARRGVERGDFGDVEVESFVRGRVALFREQKAWSGTFATATGLVFETRFRPMPDGGGVYVYRDVTERARQEAELVREHDLVEATLRSMGEGLAVYGPDRRLRIANEVVRRLFEIPRALAEPGVLFDDIIRFHIERGHYGRVGDVEALVRQRAGAFVAGKPASWTWRLADGGAVDIGFSPMPDGGGVFVFRDVTERVVREAALAEKTALLEATLHAMGEGIAVFDAGGELMLSNDEFVARLLDAPLETVRRGARIGDLLRLRVARGDFGDVTVQSIIDAAEAAARTGEPLIVIGRVPGGRAVETRVNPMRDGGFVLVFRDVTDLADREARIAERNALLEATLANMSEGIAVYGPDRRLLIRNALLAPLLEAPAELLQIGARLDDFIRYRVERRYYGDMDFESVVAARDAAFEAGRTLAMTGLTPGGRTIDGRANAMPGGGVVVVFRDVTERTNRIARLAETNAFLEAVLRNMGEGVLVFGADWRVRFANDLAARLLDVPPSLVAPGADIRSLLRFRAERGDFGAMDVDAVVADRMSFLMEQRIWRTTRRLTDGRSIEMWGDPLPDGGAVFLVRDVSERAGYEAKLREALGRAEQASQAKSEFLAMASHELRTPMNAIIGMSALLGAGDLPEAERRQAHAVETAGEGLLVVIRDLLEFASRDAGQAALDLQAFDPRALVASAIDLVRFARPEQGVTFRTEFEPGVPAALVGDGGRIARVLVHLLDNAIKHAAGRAVTVRARAAADETGRLRLRVEVEDDGEGFPPEEAARLFEPFERGAMTDRTRAPGLGLGLAISKSLVDLMGGAIGAAPAPGAGSLFWFELPVDVPEPTQPMGLGAPEASGARTLKILVAEDVEANREVMRAMLGKLGHGADFVEDGLQAVEAARSRDYDVILMDVQMPNMNGMEATRAIRALGGRMAGVPIIAVSAYALPADRQAAASAGLSGFLSKPLRRSALESALSAAAVRREGADRP